MTVCMTTRNYDAKLNPRPAREYIACMGGGDWRTNLTGLC